MFGVGVGLGLGLWGLWGVEMLFLAAFVANILLF